MSAYSALVLASNPNAYWRLGEAYGSTAALSEVNNATMQGLYEGVVGLGTTGLLTGDVNTAATMTQPMGATAFDNLHHPLQDVGDIFTIEFWLKRSTLGSVQTPYGNGTSNSFCVRFNADDTFRLDKEGVVVIVTSTVAVADTTTKHHIVATKNGATSCNLYLDGVDVSGTVTNATIVNPTAAWFIATDSSFAFGYNGVLDEVALYPTALSAATVLSHYQIGSGGPNFGKSGVFTEDKTRNLRLENGLFVGLER